MQKVNSSLLYGLGKHLGWIEDVKAGETVGGLSKKLAEASAMLGLCGKSADIPSLTPLVSCLSKAKVLEERLEEFRQKKSDYILNQYELDFLKSQLYRFEGALQAELADTPLFYVPQRGIYNTASLIDKAETVFSQQVLERLPSEAIADLRQCGRALAFDLPTASGFHGCRAVEAVIKKQVLLFSGSPAPDTNWGDYCRILKDNSADKRVVDSIFRLKDVHRNPLIHPEITLTASEAATLFAVCCSAIQACVADMETKSIAPAKDILELLPPEESSSAGSVS